MLSFVHFGFNLGVYWFVSLFGFFEFGLVGVVLLGLSELIDIDHLFSKPIYHSRRNPFKVHFFHKNWKFVFIVSLVFLFFYPLVFLGLGLISHLILDWIYVKMYVDNA